HRLGGFAVVGRGATGREKVHRRRAAAPPDLSHHLEADEGTETVAIESVGHGVLRQDHVGDLGDHRLHPHVRSVLEPALTPWWLQRAHRYPVDSAHPGPIRRCGSARVRKAVEAYIPCGHTERQPAPLYGAAVGAGHANTSARTSGGGG